MQKAKILVFFPQFIYSYDNQNGYNYPDNELKY